MHKIPSLNGLRAISIMMVILYHFDIGNLLPKNALSIYASMLVFNGSLGVNVFFFISGYLITTLLTAEINKNGFISLKNFYIRRTIRIFPAYYFLLFVYFILQLFGYFNIKPLEWLSAITYTRQFYQNGVAELGHLWSLSVEEFFYLFWPFLFIRFKNRRIQLLIILILATVVYRTLSFEYPASYTARHTIFLSADALLIGCLFSLFNHKLKAMLQNKPLLIILWFIILAASCLINFLFNHQLAVLKGHYQTDSLIYIINAVSYGLFGNLGLITLIMIGLIVISSIHSTKGLWFNFLNSKIMDHIGKLSYSLYLWQQLFTAHRPYLHQIPILVLFLCIVAAAHISYYGIELPFLKLKKRFSA